MFSFFFRVDSGLRLRVPRKGFAGSVGKFQVP